MTPEIEHLFKVATRVIVFLMALAVMETSVRLAGYVFSVELKPAAGAGVTLLLLPIAWGAVRLYEARTNKEVK